MAVKIPLRRLFLFPLFLSVLAALSGCSGGAAVARSERSFMEAKAIEAARKSEAAFNAGDLNKALAYSAESLRINRSMDNRKGELMGLINTGRLLVNIGDYERARVYLRDAVNLALSQNDRESLSEAYATEAKADLLSGSISSAMDNIEEALSIDGSLGRPSGEKMNLKGMILLREEMLKEAASTFEEALKANRSEGNTLEAANSMRALGDIKKRERRASEALDLYRGAYEIDKDAGDSGKIALDLLSMADIYFEKGDFKESAFLYERSYVVSLNAGDRRRAIKSLDRVIESYRALGDEPRALYYKRMREGVTGEAVGER